RQSRAVVTWVTPVSCAAMGRCRANPSKSGRRWPVRREEWRLFDLCISAAQLRAHNLCAGHHRFELAESNVPGQVFHAAVGRDDEVFGSDEGECPADALRDRFRRLDRHVEKVEDAEYDLLAREVGQDGAVEIRLCRLQG